MNRESSRSHAVFTLVIQATEVVEEEGLTRSRVARFNLVDLAGSERQKDTQVCFFVVCVVCCREGGTGRNERHFFSFCCAGCYGRDYYKKVAGTRI